MTQATCRTCGASGPPWNHVPSLLDPNGVGDPGHKMSETTQHNGGDELRERLCDAIFPPSEHSKLGRMEYRGGVGMQLTGEFQVIGNFEPAIDRVMRLINKREKSLTKAYGGCTNCYGKGYATVNDRWHGYDTDTDIGSPGGYVSGGDANAMKFCTCDRGEQLEKMLARQAQSLTKSLLAEVEERMVGEDEELYTDFMNIRSPIRGFTEAEKRNRNRAKQREILDAIRQERLGTKEENTEDAGIR